MTMTMTMTKTKTKTTTTRTTTLLQLQRLLVLSLLLVFCGTTAAFLAPDTGTAGLPGRKIRSPAPYRISMAAAAGSGAALALALALALGDYSIELERPLGMILEEREDGGSSGVRVQSVVKDAETAGSAWKTGRIAPGDVLLAIDGADVSSSDFETVMELLTTTTTTTTTLVLGDGLGRFDMPPNVLKRLETPEDAMMIDAVVREAVRKIRRDGRLGDVLRVEVIVGAGVSQQQQKTKTTTTTTTTTTTQRRGMVRFFAIFSTDGVSTYSCNVSATGVETDENDENDSSSNAIRIVSLSCAKDEGLGRTYDLIQEEETSKAQ